MTTPTRMPLSLSKTFPVMIISPKVAEESAVGHSAHRIIEELESRDRTVIISHSLDDAEAAMPAYPHLACLVISWGLLAESPDAIEQTLRIIRMLRDRSTGLPVILGASSLAARGEVPIEIIEEVEGYIWVPEDSPRFIAGRIDSAMRRYLDTILPPFFGAMVNFDGDHNYSWHTPGHTGGTAYMKTAVGRAFLNFYGEQMFRSDLSVSADALGSLNDHSGPTGEAEKYAAKVFGADHTFFSVGGSSASNLMIMRSSIADGDIALVDRNCHKSLNYSLNISGAIPVYLKPRRNARGVIGPVPASELDDKVIAQKLQDSPLVTDKKQRPMIAALTNSTYDGLCYNVETTTAALSKVVDRIHYDEAWYAYARFNSIYEGRYGMHRGKRSPDDATVSVTHSTHKLLAALSQASMIHVRSGRVPLVPELFNESFMMNTSTSPQYAIIASTDVSSKMMNDAGPSLTDECIRESVAFRKTMLRVKRDLERRNAGDWWFETWQADTVDGTDFIEVDDEHLVTSPDPWILKPGAIWHGFGDLGEDYCMLDPIKVTTLTPGLGPDGKLLKDGIPAKVVVAFLETRGIVVEKTEPYSFLTLFSVGITKGKWASLVAGLMEFKELYDQNVPLTQALPGIAAEHGERYAGMGLHDLCAEMHEGYIQHDILGSIDAAFSNLPEPVLSPRESFARLVHGEVEKIRVSEMMDRILAVQIVPYPPGIPILMPGERFDKSTQGVGDYLLGLEAFDNNFPGFHNHTHGIDTEAGPDGKLHYELYCIK